MAKRPAPIITVDRRAGFQELPDDLAWKASRRWRAAHRIIPISSAWIMACCAIAMLAALACLFSILSRPNPVLFLSYPDGSIRCAPTPLDPSTGKQTRRPAHEIAVCRQLDFKYGAGQATQEGAR